MSSAAAERADVVLAGGGLANSLIALALKARRPELKVVALERAPVRSDSHTWSFFDADIDAKAHDLLRPLTIGRWPAYHVCFPDQARRLSTGYASVGGERLGAALEAALGSDLRRGAEVAELTPTHARLADGSVIAAPLVIDGRGQRGTDAFRCGWQVFRGLEVELEAPHGLTEPVVMDADLPQVGGFRFFYLLPFTPTRMLIEDTRYSDSPTLDDAEVEGEIRAYAHRRGWRIASVVRREEGALPVTLGGDIHRFWREAGSETPLSGMRAALFHPTTGYSLPDAVRLACRLAEMPVLESRPVAAAVRSLSIRLWDERRFFRTLNRMLFLAAEPEKRFVVMARFYRLRQPLIERFYAGGLTPLDELRILVGKPPVPIWRALKALPASAVPTLQPSFA